mgnify:CR=1 FL=1
MYKNIKSMPLNFPEEVSEEAKDLITVIRKFYFFILEIDGEGPQE